MNDQIVPTESNTKKSALTLLLEGLKDQKKPNATDVKAVKNSFVKAMGEREKIQKALEEFDRNSAATAVAMVKCFGAQKVTVGGVLYIPTSRGERIYYKKMSDRSEAVSLDD